jgi:predicted phosphodiesterase
MKILVLSDLHLEFNPFYPAKDKVDVVVLAGDIWTGDQAIPWARKNWPDTPIVYVAGNHEFYKRDRIKTLADLKSSAEQYAINFLENEEVIISGVRFIGCTLWTDFLLFGEDKYLDCLRAANAGLNDFRLISQNNQRFSAEDAVKLHRESRGWLKTKLIFEPFNGDTVVVTHHCPSWNSVAVRYQNDLLSACFSSGLESLLGASKLWIHGHTHDSFDYVESGTRVICNPRGYQFVRAENERFIPNKIIDLE